MKIWASEKEDDVIICYCSQISRGEIRNAAKNGCRTILDVREYINKHITGQCTEKNPSGKCCNNVFLDEIKKGVSCEN